MSQQAEIFKKHYSDYLAQIGEIDPDTVNKILGIETRADHFLLPFLGRDFQVSARGISDLKGEQPNYGLCVILARYLLNCPSEIHHDPQWVTFREFRKISHFTNVNYFATDTEQALVKHFSGRMTDLIKACEKLGGMPDAEQMPYDLTVSFQAFPRIRLLLLFNDRDEEFPAQCKVLFNKHSEFYLDPEALAMTGAALAKTLKDLAPKA